jgi:hypothetical protein
LLPRAQRVSASSTSRVGGSAPMERTTAAMVALMVMRRRRVSS